MESSDIELKTSLEVVRVRRTARAVSRVFRALADRIRAGATTEEVAGVAEELLISESVHTVLRGYRGYPATVCTSVNSVAVHGIPGDYELQPGDIVTVDLTAQRDGWHGDAAWTYAVPPASPDVRRLVRASWWATLSGIRAARAGNRFGDIGQAIERVAARFGCSVLDRFVGHGIGRSIHEEPMVLHTGEAGTGAPIVPGMVFTVEPILSLGRPEVFSLDDGWSMVTEDRSLCAQFEHTIGVFGNHTDVLSWDGPAEDLDSETPPYGYG